MALPIGDHLEHPTSDLGLRPELTVPASLSLSVQEGEQRPTLVAMPSARR